jgi:hypothetical protein
MSNTLAICYLSNSDGYLSVDKYLCKALCLASDFGNLVAAGIRQVVQ